MSITAEQGQVVWRMRPGRARKIAAVLLIRFPAASEGPRLMAAAADAEQPPRSIHSQ